MTLTLLLIIIPVIGSVLGLLSKSWDDTKKSRIKLTIRGWISLSIITLGFCLTIFMTVQTQNKNDQLTAQRNKVRSFVYQKLQNDCMGLIRPLTAIYLQNRRGSIGKVNNNYDLCIEMVSPTGQRTFKDCNLMDSVKHGTEFEEWDRSYATYIYKYYNSKYPNDLVHDLEQTTAKFAPFIDSEDLLLIDTILNHEYFTTLKNVNVDIVDEKAFKKRMKDVGILTMFDNDSNYLKEQNDLISHIVKLLKKSKGYIYPSNL